MLNPVLKSEREKKLILFGQKYLFRMIYFQIYIDRDRDIKNDTCQQPLPFSSSLSSTSIITTNDSSPSYSFNQSNHHEISSINLLEGATDSRHKLETVILKDSFECLDMKWWTQIETDIQNILNEGNNQHMKEIEGLSKRLSDLNTFLV